MLLAGLTFNQYNRGRGRSTNHVVLDLPDQDDEEYDHLTNPGDALNYHIRREDLVEHYRIMKNSRLLDIRR